jgi:hypothetical protein
VSRGKTVSHPRVADVDPRVVAKSARGVGSSGVGGARRSVSPRKRGMWYGGLVVVGGRREREEMWEREVGVMW